MSNATMLRKTQNTVQTGHHVGTNPNGRIRTQGYIGQTSLSTSHDVRSLQTTKGGMRGHGGGHNWPMFHHKINDGMNQVEHNAVHRTVKSSTAHDFFLQRKNHICTSLKTDWTESARIEAQSAPCISAEGGQMGCRNKPNPFHKFGMLYKISPCCNK